MPVKVSICIPTYKQTEFLKKTLDSVLEQTFTDYELLISDDTPGDTVEKLLSNYKNKFADKLQYHKNVPALGSPSNWNAVMRKAKGEYIKILHHDDWFSRPDSLAIFVGEMKKHPLIDFGFSASSSYNVSKNSTQKNFPSQEFLKELKNNPATILFGNFIGAPSTTIFRNPSLVAFDEKLKWVVDMDFYIRTLEKSGDFVYIGEDLITSVSGVAHSVTNECMTKEVEVFEYVYLYNRLKRKTDDDKKYINFFLSLFINYNVDPEELKKLTGLSEFDKNIQKALALKKSSGLQKAYNKAKRLLKSFMK